MDVDGLWNGCVEVAVVIVVKGGVGTEPTVATGVVWQWQLMVVVAMVSFPLLSTTITRWWWRQ